VKDFAEILLGLPEYLPQALVGGCRKAWKSFVKSFASQSSEEGENDEAMLTNNSSDAPPAHERRGVLRQPSGAP
jgi:hypothetical protein